MSSMKFLLKRFTIMSITATLAMSLVSPSLAFAGDISTNVQEKVSKRTEQELFAKWMMYLPIDIDRNHMFEVKPSYSAPYKAGKLKQNVLQDGLNATNFARYLAGLPDDVTLDYPLVEQQQAGAIINSKITGLSHYPSKPSDMSDAFYELAATSAKSSNLSGGRSSLYETIFFGFMSDNGHNNLDAVGHRRWIINPQMKKTMFGYADNPSSTYGTYFSMSAFDKDRNINEVEYDYIAWPSAGIFPSEMLLPSDPWSVSLNTSVYDKSNTSDIKVTLTREKDNKVWKLSAKNRNYDGDFFNINLYYYGIDFAIIFRPGNIKRYEADDVFHVKIDGLRKQDGSSASLSYTTSFTQLQSYFDNDNRRYMVAGQKIKFPVNKAANRYVSSNPSVASIDANGVVTAHRAGFVEIKADGYISSSNSYLRIEVKDKQDKPVSSWALPSVIDANKFGLLQFNPYNYDLTAPVTRQDFVSYAVGLITAIDPTINIYNYDNTDSPFTDVYDSQFDIIWAYENKIISGTGQGKFLPRATITREQAATLLMNVYHYLGGNLKDRTAQAFSDTSKVSSWASSAVKNATELSIMGGVSDTRFDPQGKYSSEQTIVTMLRLYKMLTP